MFVCEMLNFPSILCWHGISRETSHLILNSHTPTCQQHESLCWLCAVSFSVLMWVMRCSPRWLPLLSSLAFFSFCPVNRNTQVLGAVKWNENGTEFTLFMLSASFKPEATLFGRLILLHIWSELLLVSSLVVSARCEEKLVEYEQN